MPSFGRATLVGVIWSGFGRVGFEFVAVPTAMVLARLLSPDDFGQAAAAGFFIQLANRVTNFGFNTALLRQKDVSATELSTVFWFNLGVSAVAAVLLVTTSPWLAEWFRSDALRRLLPVAALSFVIGAAGSVQEVLLARDLRYRAKAFIEASGGVVSTIVSISLALAAWGALSLILGQVASVLFALIARTWLTRWRPQFRFSSAVIRGYLSYGLGLQVKRVLDSATLNLDNLIVARVLDMSALGFYDKAFSTMNRALTLLSSSGPSVTFRVFALVQDDEARFRSAFRKAVTAATTLGFPLLAWMVGSAAPLITVLFGAHWAPSVVPFQILCLSAFGRLSTAYASAAVQSKGQIWGDVWRQLANVVLMVVGAALGALWFGLAGAATGVTLASLVQLLMMPSLVRGTCGITRADFARAHAPALVLSGLVVAACWAVGLAVGASATPFAVLVGQTLVSLVVWYAFVARAPLGEFRSVMGQAFSTLVPGLVADPQRPRRWDGLRVASTRQKAA